MYLSYSSPETILDTLQAETSNEASPLWLLCVSDCHAEQLPALLAAATQRGVRLCGAVFPGVIRGDEAFTEGVVAIPMPAGSEVFLAKLDDADAQWDKALPDLPQDSTFSSVVFVDCLSLGITHLLEGLYDRYGSRLSHFGAGCGYHDLRREPLIFHGEHFTDQAALMVISPKRATVGIRHGWERIAGPFVASRTEGSVIQELNWETAGTIYLNNVVEKYPEYADRPIFPDLNSQFPLCIAKEGGEDVMRDPMWITDQDEVKVLSDVSENSVMYLAHGDQASLIAAAAAAVQDCGQPNDVASCFISDCYSRVLMLGDNFPNELKAANHELQQFTQVVPEGVMALGEVADSGGKYLELFNKTFVVALTHT